MNLIFEPKHFDNYSVLTAVQVAFQTSIRHELINEHKLTFIHTISDQINKIPMMETAEQIYLRLKFSLSLAGI